MTSAKLISNSKKEFRTKFKVEIDISDIGDYGIKRIIEKLKDIDWDFTDDLVKIIENG